MRRSSLPVVCVDFDGVIHEFKSPWKRADLIPDPPTKGALEWLHGLLPHFDVVVLSARSSHRRALRAMRSWLEKHARKANLWFGSGLQPGLEEVRFVKDKPAALVYIDDRGWTFKGPGTFPTPAQIRGFKAWNEK